MRRRFLFYALAVLLLFWGCDNLIEYSPYQSGTGNYPKNRNVEAVEFLSEKSCKAFQPFTIALIGDSHTYYDDFADQIEFLNQIDSIDFVVHNGDITLSGIYREFLWFNDILSSLKHPMITLIGNHDYLSNGEFVYKNMFGPFNFILEYNNCRFVFFDDVIWEKNVQDPDFDWLRNACCVEEGNDPDYIFVFAHIPPWDSSFSIGNRFFYYRLLEDKEVDLSIHGHTHSFFYGNKDDCDVPFLITGDSTDREIVLLEIKEDTIAVTRQPI